MIPYFLTSRSLPPLSVSETHVFDTPSRLLFQWRQALFKLFADCGFGSAVVLISEHFMISLILVGLSSNICNQEMYFCFQGTLRGKYLYIYYTYRSHDYYRRLNSNNSYFVYYCDTFVFYFDTCNNVFQIFLNHFNTMRTILQIKKYFRGGGVRMILMINRDRIRIPCSKQVSLLIFTTLSYICW